MILNAEATEYFIEHGCVGCSLQEELGVSCDTSTFPCPRCQDFEGSMFAHPPPAEQVGSGSRADLYFARSVAALRIMI